MRIGRMRVYCRKAILTALSPSANPLIRHAAFVVMQNGNVLLSGNRRLEETSALRRRDTFPTRGKAFF